jgi:hypothetical protein
VSAALTEAQRKLLDVAILVGGGWYPGPKGASTARSLVRRGLLFKHGEFGPYSPTEAGRQAVALSHQGGKAS